MSDVLSFNPNRALTANIDAAAAARAFFYDAGTTTLRTVYADSALTTPHASPLVANASGIFPAVYVDGAAVKVVAQDAAGATLYTLDPCVKVSATAATAAQVSFAPSTAAPYANVQAAIDGLSVLRNGEDSDRIINGDFGIWQRSAASNGVGYFAADRWYNSCVGGNAAQSREEFAPGDNLGTAGLNPTYFLRQSVTGQTLPSHLAGTIQRIEGVRSYAGVPITVLGWARRSSGAGNLAVQGVQSFGTGGTGISPNWFTAGTRITLTGAWAPFAVTFTIQSIAGKTIGTNSDDYFALNFYASLGADYAGPIGLQTIGVDLWGIHVRQGTWTAADTALYRPRDRGTELLLCQRFYETGSISDDGGIGVKYGLAGANKYNAGHPFQVTKRGQATISFPNPPPTYVNCSAITAAIADGIRGFTSRVTVTATGDYRCFDGRWTADAEI